MPKFQTPHPITATLDIAAGDVRITAGDRGETIVTVEPRNPASAADVSAAENAVIDFADGQLVVKTSKDWKRHLPFLGPFGGGPTVEVSLVLPSGSRIEGRTGLGAFHCSGRLGACRLDTGAGGIVVDMMEAAVLKTGFGDISADLIDGQLRAATANGDLAISTVRGNAELSTSNGTIRIGAVGGDLQARTASGRIAVDVAQGSVRAKTANGSVTIGSVARGTVEIDTAAGEIGVGVREGTAAWLDLDTPNGNVRNALDTVGGPQMEDDRVEIRARTSFGDIMIRRAADADASADTVE